jgi:hypothetical protein
MGREFNLLATAGHWALAIGLLLFALGMGASAFAHAGRRRMLSCLHDRRPGLWQQLVDGKVVSERGYFALFDWSQRAIRTGDSLLDAMVWRQRRIEQVSALLALPGALLLALGLSISMFV